MLPVKNTVKNSAMSYLQYQLIQITNVYGPAPAPILSVPQPVDPSTTMTKKESIFYNCNYCSGEYANKYNLKRHIKMKHPDKVVDNTINKKFKCSKCERTYSTSNILKKHERLKHGVYSCKRQNWLNCPICSEPCANLELLCTHVAENHDIDICRKMLEFSSEKEFLVWKNREELETKSLYVKRMSSRCTKNNEITYYYYCNRSGFYKRSGKNKSRLKSQGSCKIGSFCTAHMKVKTVQGEKHHVQYVKTHVGHSKDLNHLRLSKIQRDELASKIRNNIPFDEILEEVRSSTLTSISRLHLLTRKDLYNIRKEYGLDNKAKLTKSVTMSDRLVKSRKEKIKKKMLELEERHQASLSLSDESVIKFQDGFIVPSSSDEDKMYVVQLNKSDCNCNFRCKDCCVCIHNFSCTCIDATIKRNMCKHIHLVCKIEKVSEDIEETSSVLDLDTTNA